MEHIGQTQQLIDHLARTPLSRVLIFVVVCTILRLAVYPTIMKTAAHKRGEMYKSARFFDSLLDAVLYAGVFVFFLIRPFFLQTFTIPSGSMVPTLMVNDLILVNKTIYRYTNPQRGDIVVFRPPAEAVDRSMLDEDGAPNVDFVKRCIGVPGDTIEVKNDELFRNGSPVEEPYKHFMVRDLDLSQETYHDVTPVERDPGNKLDFKLVFVNNRYWPVYYLPDSSEPVFQRTQPAFQVSPSDFILQHKLVTAPPAKIPSGFYLMMGDNRDNSSDGRSWGLVPRENIIGRAEFIWWPLGHIHRPH